MPKFAFIALVLSSWALISCEKNESDDINKAQKCLDEVRESNPDDALKCLEFVKAYDSQQANILKCSIYISSGGLMETKITKGYNILKDSSQTNKSASFMAVLALDYPTVSAGYDKAVLASGFCNASGVAGLKYLSDIVVAGSFMAKTLAALGGPAIDVNNPATVNAAVQNLITQCAPSAGPPAASCTTDLPQLGEIAVSLAGSYCATAGADPNVCTEINSAVAAAGASTADVGQALLCYMAGKTFNATTHQCN